MPKKGADLIHILVGVTLESDIFIILSFIVKLFNFSISIELQKKDENISFDNFLKINFLN